MSEKRFRITTLPKSNAVAFDEKQKKHYIGIDFENLLNDQQATINQLKEENMDLRAKQTQMIIIMKDVVRDLKRMDTYRYAEHLEKIANLHFLSEKELEDE